MPTNTKQQLCIKPTGFLVRFSVVMDFNSEKNNESTYRNAFEEFLRQQSAENDFKEGVS